MRRLFYKLEQDLIRKKSQYVESLRKSLKFQQNLIKKNERFHRRIATALIFVYLYLQFQFASFLAISSMLIGVYQLVCLELKIWKQQGLIYYLPVRVQNILTNSSIFDVFRLIWNPNLFLYLKTFYKPFFLNISPDEAVETLQDLPENARNVILTKGIVYSLPRFLQNVLLPLQLTQELAKRDEELNAKKEMLAIEDNVQQTDLIDQKQNQKWGVQKDHDLKKNTQKRNQLSIPYLSEQEGELEKFGRKSGFLYNTLLHQEGDYQFSENRVDRQQQIGHLSSNREFQPLKKTAEGLLPQLKTKVIASSSDLVQKKQKSVSAEDRMASFFEGLKNQLNSVSGDSTLGQIKNAINLLSGVAELKKKSNLMASIETKRIYKLFMLSSIFLLSQYFISKKTRKWVISSSMFAAYIMSFFLTFGSLGLFIYKQSNQYPAIGKPNLPMTSKKPHRRKEQTFQEDSQFD